MKELMEADILIMAKGCFSYYARLICDGIKIFEPRTFGEDDSSSWKWRSVPPVESWIACRTDGSLDRETFERQLLIVIRLRAWLELKHRVARCDEKLAPIAFSEHTSRNAVRPGRCGSGTTSIVYPGPF